MLLWRHLCEIGYLYENQSTGHPGNPSYWDLFVNSVTPTRTYDLPAGVDLTAWCGDKYHYISPGTFDAYVYPSLYDN